MLNLPSAKKRVLLLPYVSRSFRSRGALSERRCATVGNSVGLFPRPCLRLEVPEPPALLLGAKIQIQQASGQSHIVHVLVEVIAKG